MPLAPWDDCLLAGASVRDIFRTRDLRIHPPPVLWWRYCTAGRFLRATRTQSAVGVHTRTRLFSRPRQGHDALVGLRAWARNRLLAPRSSPTAPEWPYGDLGRRPWGSAERLTGTNAPWRFFAFRS